MSYRNVLRHPRIINITMIPIYNCNALVVLITPANETPTNIRNKYIYKPLLHRATGTENSNPLSCTHSNPYFLLCFFILIDCYTNSSSLLSDLIYKLYTSTTKFSFSQWFKWRSNLELMKHAKYLLCTISVDWSGVRIWTYYLVEQWDILRIIRLLIKL